MNIWMDRIKERVIVKDFFLKGHGSKLIHKELASALQDNAISLSGYQFRAKSYDYTFSRQTTDGF
jgi:hypothetical protein